MSDKNNTPPSPEGDVKFQIQALTKIMKRVNFMMGNMCDKLEKVEKHGNKVDTSTQDVRKVGVDLKSNNGWPERPKSNDYDDFEENVDNFDDGDFKDETIGRRGGFWKLRN